MSEKQHIDYLDGLRGWAAMMVVVSHFSNYALVSVSSSSAQGVSTWQRLLNLFFGAFGNGAGQVGVMCFFSLSAFLMFHLYFEKEASNQAIGRFVIGRVARIFPLYYFVIFLSFLVDRYLPFHFLGISEGSMMGHLIFVKSTSVLWTIAPELIFYLVFICLWRFLGQKPFFLAIPLIIYLLVCNSLPLEGSLNKVEYFVLGFFVWLIYKNNCKLGFEAFGHFGVAAFMCVYLFFLPAVQRQIGVELPFSGWENHSYLLYILFIYLGAFDSKHIQQIFSMKLVRFLGKISFSVYLMHLLVLHFMLYTEMLRPTLVSLLAAIILVIGISSLSYYVIEVPSRRWIRKLSARFV